MVIGLIKQKLQSLHGEHMVEISYDWDWEGYSNK